MKKFSNAFILLLMALLVFSLSGCGGSSGTLPASSSSGTTPTSGDTTPTSGDTTPTSGDSSTQYQTEIVALTESGTVTPSATLTTNSDGSYNIVLSYTSSDSTNANAAALTEYENDFVWHISPDVPGEFWTEGYSITGTSRDEDYVLENVTSNDGIYIAHDIRYVPNTLTFSSTTVTKESGTAEGANDKLYPAYYSDNAGTVDGVSGSKFILAALPSGMMGGGMGGGNTGNSTELDTLKAQMTHSPYKAYNNPVLHITRPGTYYLSGKWIGQIWVDIPDKTVNSSLKTKKDPSADVEIVLNGITVNCTVAPAFVFKKVYEVGPDASADVASIVRTASTDIKAKWLSNDIALTGAIVNIADGTTNSFTGTNVARINEFTINTDDGYSSSDVGTYVKAQEKMYKLDGAFHSRMSMVIDLASDASSGTLNVASDYEGLNSEMHMLINNGTINVSADDDGINVNEDDTSVFYLAGGTVSVTSTNEDGIDSNGYIILENGTLNITAGNSATGQTSGIDYDRGYYKSDSVTYNYTPATGGMGGEQPGGTPPSGEQPGGTPPSAPGSSGGFDPFSNNSEMNQGPQF